MHKQQYGNSWLVWDGKIYIGTVDYYNRRKYVLGPDCFDNITVRTPVGFPSLRECAEWMTKNSSVAKRERKSYKEEKARIKKENKENKNYLQKVRKIESLAKKFGIEIIIKDKE